MKKRPDASGTATSSTERSPVSAALTDVFRDVFGQDDLVVHPATSAPDVAGWDSLMHVTLVLEVERVFGIRLSSSEVAMLRDAGELQAIIDAHLDVS